MSNEYMLTTIDNPYNPFEQFDSWFLFDVERGHNTCSYLARIVHITDELSEEEIDAEIDRAMNEIIKNDETNLYKKIKPGEKPEVQRIEVD